MEKLKIIISGGGTGGHIFPALAIAGEFIKRFPGSDILFVGASGRMEMEKVPAAGFPIKGLPVIGFPRKPGVEYLRFLVRFIQSMAQAHRIVREFKPDIAIGVGGYASGPILRAALSRHIPVLIQEQNSWAGKANKWLGEKAATICVAYEGMESFFPAEKIVLTGNPVRESMLAYRHSAEEALEWFGLTGSAQTILITGGSLGARSLNDAVIRNLDAIRKSGIAVIWQTGSLYYREMMAKTGDSLPENIRVYEFLDRMELAYTAADVVIARAGACTISELCLAGKPVILVPSPNVAEDHQTKNAMALVRKEAALLVRDAETGEKLFPEALALLNNPEKMQHMSANIKSMALPGATAQIVNEILKLIRK